MPPSPSPVLELTREPIDYTRLTEQVRCHAAGAVVLFLGTVREMTGERRTLALDYDAYPEMALGQMRLLAEEAAARWPLQRVGIIHRLGHLELGDVSIAVALSTPHRGAAFEAGAWLLDRLKETVPIWKKENWDDGSTEWVHPTPAAPRAGDGR